MRLYLSYRQYPAHKLSLSTKQYFCLNEKLVLFVRFRLNDFFCLFIYKTIELIYLKINRMHWKLLMQTHRIHGKSVQLNRMKTTTDRITNMAVRQHK